MGQLECCWVLWDNSQLVGQVVESAGSIGTNYREVNDALDKKDLIQKL